MRSQTLQVRKCTSQRHYAFRFYVFDNSTFTASQFALRWRTEAEVLSGAGETTCGNTRCQLHELPRQPPGTIPPTLTTLELPFTYVEQGKTKSALVKMVLCDRCFDKLMWKRRKEKERQVLADAGEVAAETEASGNATAEPEAPDGGRGSVNPRGTKMEEVEARKSWGRRREEGDRAAEEKRRQRRRSSRSQSPRSHHRSDARSLRRSSKHRSS
jgi:protein FRA10AC1